MTTQQPEAQQATCTNSDSWNCKYCNKTKTCAALAAGQPDGDVVAKGQQARWQQIETAPKDGQDILVTDGRGCYCVEWDEEFNWWTVDDNKLGPFRLRGSAPTHWMPTPAAPGPADGESNG